MSLQFCANLDFLFKEVSFLDRYDSAAKAGFSGVECGMCVYQYAIEDLKVARETAGVEQVQILAPMGDKEGDCGMAAMPGHENDFAKSLNKAIKYAKELNCKRIHFLAGKHPVNEDWNEQLWEETYCNNLRIAAEECGKNGFTALIEPIAFPSYYLNTGQQGIDIVKKLSHPNLKLQLDCHYQQLSSGSLVNFLTENISQIGHIQVSQVPVGNEPDSEGEINYPYIFKTLMAIGYQEWIGCEYTPRGKTEDGLQWAASYLTNKTV